MSDGDGLPKFALLIAGFAILSILLIIIIVILLLTIVFWLPIAFINLPIIIFFGILVKYTRVLEKKKKNIYFKQKQKKLSIRKQKKKKKKTEMK